MPYTINIKKINNFNNENENPLELPLLVPSSAANEERPRSWGWPYGP
jgi:hypothetical protein